MRDVSKATSTSKLSTSLVFSLNIADRVWGVSAKRVSIKYYITIPRKEIKNEQQSVRYRREDYQR